MTVPTFFTIGPDEAVRPSRKWLNVLAEYLQCRDDSRLFVINEWLDSLDDEELDEFIISAMDFVSGRELRPDSDLIAATSLGLTAEEGLGALLLSLGTLIKSAYWFAWCANSVQQARMGLVEICRPLSLSQPVETAVTLTEQGRKIGTRLSLAWH